MVSGQQQPEKRGQAMSENETKKSEQENDLSNQKQEKNVPERENDLSSQSEEISAPVREDALDDQEQESTEKEQESTQKDDQELDTVEPELEVSGEKTRAFDDPKTPPEEIASSKSPLPKIALLVVACVVVLGLSIWGLVSALGTEETEQVTTQTQQSSGSASSGSSGVRETTETDTDSSASTEQPEGTTTETIVTGTESSTPSGGSSSPEQSGQQVPQGITVNLTINSEAGGGPVRPLPLLHPRRDRTEAGRGGAASERGAAAPDRRER